MSGYKLGYGRNQNSSQIGHAMPANPAYVAFAGARRIAAGDLADVARTVRECLDAGESEAVLVLDGANGRAVDLDLRGTPDEVADRVRLRQEAERAAAERSNRGRPRLGVVAREVTLLPRHWDWVSAQPGGASVTLRKLVEAARKQNQASADVRRRQDVAYRTMLALAGDREGYEEAIRALYAWDLPGVAARIDAWPPDIRAQVLAIVGEEGAGAAPRQG